MKFRVIHPNFFPTYFKTKKEALAHIEKFEGSTLQKKMAGQWFDWE